MTCQIKSVYWKGVGPWTADTLGVNDSCFVAMFTIVAAFIVGYALRLKQFEHQEWLLWLLGVLCVRDMLRQKKQLSSEHIIQSVFSVS